MLSVWEDNCWGAVLHQPVCSVLDCAINLGYSEWPGRCFAPTGLLNVILLLHIRLLSMSKLSYMFEHMRSSCNVSIDTIPNPNFKSSNTSPTYRTCHGRQHVRTFTYKPHSNKPNLDGDKDVELPKQPTLSAPYHILRVHLHTILRTAFGRVEPYTQEYNQQEYNPKRKENRASLRSLSERRKPHA